MSVPGTARHGTQSLRLARAGYDVATPEPDAETRPAFAAALNDDNPDVLAARDD